MKPGSQISKKKAALPSGLFVTVEGTEGAGKSTLIRLLEQRLNAHGIHTLLTREPGGTPLAEELRTLILEREMSAWTEVLLYEAARADHVHSKILPALREGKVVICDRFTDSTLAYQSAARGLPWAEIERLNRLATAGLKPDLTLLLDIDVETGLLRAKDPNRFEREDVGFHRKVRQGFLKSLRRDPKRWLRLKADGSSAESLAEKALETILKKASARRKLAR